MGEIKLEYPDTSPCYHCHSEVGIDLERCPDCEEELPYRFHVGQLLLAFTSGRIIDVRPGGLVLGRHGPEDDIPMYNAVVPGILELCGMMHGGEFVLNAQAAKHNAARLEEINSYKNPDYTPRTNIPLTDTTRVFNTNGLSSPETHLVVLMQSGQFVVNRAATIKYYSELEEINNSVAPILG